MKLEKPVAYDCPRHTRGEYFEQSNYMVGFRGKRVLAAGGKGLFWSPGISMG